MANLQLNESTKTHSTSNAVVVGIYGIPGSGKTLLLNQLKHELPENFAFYEGSEMIGAVVPGGLDTFQKLDEQKRTHWRQFAINNIVQQYAENRQVAVVAGHYMFWPEDEEAGRVVWTPSDSQSFTHIVYLNVPAIIVAQYRLNDTQRDRPSISAAHLSKWQQTEKSELRQICRDRGILFSTVSAYPTVLGNILPLLRDFQQHTEEYNLSYAQREMDGILSASQAKLKIMLIMDADKTLAAEDSTARFWKIVTDCHPFKYDEWPLKTLFRSPLGYSYTAFRQATLLYEEAADDEEFDDICQRVASAVSMHPEFISFLQAMADQEQVGAVVLTCGLRRVWDKVLEKVGLSKKVKVVGGGRIADGFVITPSVKATLVARLRSASQLHVWAFGDSPLDVDMMKNANEAIVVVGEKEFRSKSMDAALRSAIGDGGLRAHQVMLPVTAPPRLNTDILPVTRLTDPEFINCVLRSRDGRPPVQILHASNKPGAKILMKSTRDQTIAGPVLRKAHFDIGWYLAVEFLTELIGVEEHPMTHVQGHQTRGHRLAHESKTSIVALMRGGAPMALGISDVFPSAMLVHANRPTDIRLHHLEEQATVMLVDSVVNNGDTMVRFVQHIRNLNSTIRIVGVVGVVQAQAISVGSLAQAMARHPNIDLVALRVSDNKFTGRGATDTGNRLFNTTHVN